MAVTLEPLVQIKFCKFLLTADSRAFSVCNVNLAHKQFYQITAMDSQDRDTMTKPVAVTANTLRCIPRRAPDADRDLSLLW
jgi:hypothetical protein